MRTPVRFINFEHTRKSAGFSLMKSVNHCPHCGTYSCFRIRRNHVQRLFNRPQRWQCESCERIKRVRAY
ncbi:hypothetical protein T5B8_10291 [Salinisphaera sp. T5B8]|uniref:hypothetical protein n=1 Tax=Salinisphaera sp. T5B8 TaxID=1304154 RepID=UPI003340A553